ncbi:hypothetical protein [uncultured Photobacterium sp.]|uniref:hypothetical protein n=1 Tax=uncultured Photobacterium sp. TaxID=173973 RepID=UPI00262BCDCA|nr:hypothetical protein [uncultured Photobacterium sp.]
MTDIIIEILRAVMVGGIIFSLLKAQQTKELSQISGWRTIVAGFAFIFFGTLIDITDNFEELNQFVIIGDTETQAFLEKGVGYLLGFMLLAIGIRKWLPKIIEHGEITKDKHKLEVEKERVKTLRATMNTVHDIVNNFLNQLLLFQFEAEENKTLEPKSIILMESIIQDTATKLKNLGELDSITEQQMANGKIKIGNEKESPQHSIGGVEECYRSKLSETHPKQ